FRRRAGHGGLRLPDRAILRGHQPRGRPALLCGRSTASHPAHMTSPVDRIRGYHAELRDLRRDLHAHPELAFQESRTSSLVVEHLKKWGIETHTGLAKTGVVGVIQGKKAGGKSIGLRAD